MTPHHVRDDKGRGRDENEDKYRIATQAIACNNGVNERETMSIKVERTEDLSADLAKTYKRLAPTSARTSPEIIADYETLMRDGYVILHDLIDAKHITDIKNAAPDLLEHKGRNNFEGLKTQRVYDVLSKTTLIDRIADHPRILGLLDRIFLPSFLLSQAQIINILPGESAQMLHYDDGFYRIPRPRPALGAALILAVDDFTDRNGATVVIPNSHEWGDDKTPQDAPQDTPQDTQQIKAVMPAGSAIFFLGTTWHGGGANETDAPRLAVTCQYCEAYMRQQENFLLEISKERAKTMSPELRALIGYSIHPPFMGMVRGQHPARILED